MPRQRRDRETVASIRLDRLPVAIRLRRDSIATLGAGVDWPRGITPFRSKRRLAYWGRKGVAFHGVGSQRHWAAGRITNCGGAIRGLTCTNVPRLLISRRGRGRHVVDPFGAFDGSRRRMGVGIVFDSELMAWVPSGPAIFAAREGKSMPAERRHRSRSPSGDHALFGWLGAV